VYLSVATRLGLAQELRRCSINGTIEISRDIFQDRLMHVL
jgi:hypothetical protein